MKTYSPRNLSGQKFRALPFSSSDTLAFLLPAYQEQVSIDSFVLAAPSAGDLPPRDHVTQAARAPGFSDVPGAIWPFFTTSKSQHF